MLIREGNKKIIIVSNLFLSQKHVSPKLKARLGKYKRRSRLINRIMGKVYSP